MLFRTQALFDDRTEIRVIEQRLEDTIFVRIDGALYNGFAQSPSRIDHDNVGKTGFGIERKHHSAASPIGSHHPLYPDRQSDLQMIESLALAIGDRTVGEQRRIAFLTRLHQLALALDIQIGFLLAGETRLGQVLCRGTAASRHGDVFCCRLTRQVSIGFANCASDFIRKFAVHKQFANVLAGILKRLLVGIQLVELFAERFVDLVVVDEPPIGIRGGRKSTGHADALGLQRLDHLAQ